ncbi:MAG: aspartate--tRNA ligase [Planctomycetota bacterium]
MLRTHTCGELRKEHEGQTVQLAGWIDTVRDHGNLMFVDLRDRYGIVQVVINPETIDEATLQGLKTESVIQIQGKVRARPDDAVNAERSTGAVEVPADEVTVLNPSKTPKFEIEDRINLSESVRLEHRSLDLRRPSMQKNLFKRHELVLAMRNYLSESGFIEVETPILTRPTPEGARDYLVPSRVHTDRFFALPQSPQLFKQLLMVSGFDRYFQIARCFRDEDLRADRQPEFTQLDVEMSFVEEEDVYQVIEGMMLFMLANVFDVHLESPIPRLTYREAMERYGSDKPDTRFGLELVDLGELAANCEFQVFRRTAESGGRVKGIRVPGGAGMATEKGRKDLEAFAKTHGAKGLAWMKVQAGGEVQSPIGKFFSDEERAELLKAMAAEDGDLLLFVADKAKVVHAALGALRNRIAKETGLLEGKPHQLLWVTEFPLYELDEKSGRYVPAHHPFTMPDASFFEGTVEDPGAVRARSYDLVLDGVELGSGSIRIHRPDMQEKVFETMGIPKEVAREKFGFLLEAFEYGAPPHGGIALGIDRMVAILLGHDSIREVIAFPKTAAASCLLTGAPAPADAEQLEELGLRIREEARVQDR